MARLTAALTDLAEQLTTTDARRKHLEGAIGGVERDVERTSDIRDEVVAILDEAGTGVAADLSQAIELLHKDVLLRTPAECDRAQEQLHAKLTGQIEARTGRQTTISHRIVAKMGEFRRAYPVETSELDDSVQSATEYRELHRRLVEDDLPRFEARFKEYLNTNTIRDIAGFHSQLNKQVDLIKERVDIINASLVGIDYNPGRFIRLEPQRTVNVEIRDFITELRACTDNALADEASEQYSEQRFLQVSRIVERFRGREGQTEADRAWTRRVTDVRNWFVFSASERWREDDTEHEHYADSGGKSGGQKEKLAYTILAASLAYQFKLEWGAARSRTFRFAVIDEAFGRGSDESTRFALKLFRRLGLQLLIVTPAAEDPCYRAPRGGRWIRRQPDRRELAAADTHDRGVPATSTRPSPQPRSRRGHDVTSPSASAGTAWTIPADVHRRLRRRWDTGELLTSFAEGTPWSAWSLGIRGPSTADLATRYATVQEWLRAWRAPDADTVRIEYKRLGGRMFGANNVPGRAWVDSYQQLWALLGVESEVDWFIDALRAARERLPRVAEWMLKHPALALAHRQVWNPLIDTVDWIEQNPGPVYVRQVDVSGVDTKFIDVYRGILTGLLEAQLEAGRIDQAVGGSDFAGRFRFLRKPGYVRFRHLDPEPPAHGFSELTVRVDEFSSAPVCVDVIYVVENETTYLAFPSLRRSMVIFGGGYAATILQSLGWLAEHPLFYWGDIDTHGFAILNRVRQRFPHTRSLLMNVMTLLAHERHWVTEASPTIESLDHLTGDEAELYRDLIEGTYGPSVRLEQERVRFSFVRDALVRPDAPAPATPRLS